MRFSARLAVCLALCASFVLVVSCTPAPSGHWQNGTYQGKAEGLHSDIAVTVTVEKGRIAKVAIDQQGETAGVSDLAFTRIPEEIVKAQTTKVDAVAGASVSSKAIMAAVEDALTKAVKQ
jgi:uncharacterized protein with FMN-binding domain